ncbi:TPA: hypothetical protein DEP96_00695 [Candidatus Uhrbacteria bacterium]|nr:hypothetical protein [Candidatus Uhrbacteria bacterium]
MNKKTAITFATCALVIAVFVIAFLIYRPAEKAPEVKTETAATVIDEVIRNPLTGEKLEVALTELPQVTAVMVENSADAWPLVGLDQAFLVIEAPVEGMIPRFELFFAPDAVAPKIGPVRSARPYYVDWAAQFGALYAHVGGSPDALDKLRTANVTNFDQFFNGDYFWRDTATRSAPHNVYTSIENLVDAEINVKKMPVPSYTFWQFKDGAASGENHSLTIDWTAGGTYDVAWDYDAATNVYTRKQGGTANFLEHWAKVVADNVVVMESDMEVLDEKGRRSIRTTGTGSAMIAQDGQIITATWSKESETAPLRFLDEAGNEIKMNAGKTWIEVVPSLSQVTTSN